MVAARSHQAHPNEMARTTANVLGNNRIVLPWALRIYPGPTRRSESSKLPPSVKVNGFLLFFQNGAQWPNANYDEMATLGQKPSVQHVTQFALKGPLVAAGETDRPLNAWEDESGALSPTPSGTIHERNR